MKVRIKLRRSAYIAVAAVLSIVGVLSGLADHAAAGQVTVRSIRMSASNASATNVIYRVGFTVFTTGNVGGVAIDFCSNNPIIGDACSELKTDNTTPWTFDVNEGSLTVENENNIGALTVDSATTNNTVILTTTAASISSGTQVSFELGNGTTGGVTNIDEYTSFYARIYTYATSAGAQGHNTNTPAGYVDYGGIAMSTARVINITARVMETLSFCVYKTACGDDPSLTLGHTVGTATVIDDTAVDTGTANFRISTNANGGATIRMKGDTLKTAGGANDINAAGSPAVAFVAGTENFGLRISTAGTNITAVAPYAHATNYGLVVTGGGTDDVTSTYGGSIATLSGPTNNSISTITFAAAASNTTTAGTYTAAEQLIATGTF